jgi:uncharacterized protein (DUF2336 family)
MENRNSDYLYQLARSSKTADREMLAKSVTALLQSDLSKGETLLVQDILLRMLSEAESDLRRSLAIHLSTEEKCPQVLIDFLLHECPFHDSEHFLKHSVILKDDYLIDLCKRFEDPDYWRTIAARDKVSRILALYLVNTNDGQTQEILLANAGADLCMESMTKLTDIAVGVWPFQSLLLHRPEITVDLAAKIYWHASDMLKLEIIERFEIDQETLKKAMNYVVVKQTQKRATVRTISMETLGLVRKIRRISSRQIIQSLQDGDPVLFACLFATSLKINPEIVLQRLEMQTMTTLAILCRGYGLSLPDFSQLYLQWRRLEQPHGMIQADEIVRAVQVYNNMSTVKARTEIEKMAA